MCVATLSPRTQPQNRRFGRRAILRAYAISEGTAAFLRKMLYSIGGTEAVCDDPKADQELCRFSRAVLPRRRCAGAGNADFPPNSCGPRHNRVCRPGCYSVVLTDRQ